MPLRATNTDENASHLAASTNTATADRQQIRDLTFAYRMTGMTIINQVDEGQSQIPSRALPTAFE